MCLIAFSWQPQAEFPLLLAANRDEFHARPSAAAGYWDEHPDILAGRDLEAGGTWLGLSRRGRFAAVTNVRDPQRKGTPAPRSRGDLTRDFLLSLLPPRDYLAEIAARADQYQGFNLLLFDGSELWYLHGGREESWAPRRLAPGNYGLSNAALDVPWPKVTLAQQRLQQAMDRAAPQAPTLAQLREVLADRSPASAEALSRQGLQGEMAQRLSAQFIVTDAYGTRCCSTLRWHRAGAVDFAEQRFDRDGATTGESNFRLTVAADAP